MPEISKEAKMIIASNLTVAAAIRDAAMAMKSGPQPVNSKDIVLETFTEIFAGLEKKPDVTT